MWVVERFVELLSGSAEEVECYSRHWGALASFVVLVVPVILRVVDAGLVVG